LIVRPNGKGFAVTDGGKRLEAAQALVKAGEWAANAPIPVKVIDATDAQARERSLALNVIREDMHPVDQYRAFAQLHADKEAPLDVTAIAEHFGIAEKAARQVLALGDLDDAILDAWLEGEIKAETAQAFTLCPVKKDQAKLYAKLKKSAYNGGRISTDDVKEALKVSDAGKTLNAVGIEAYEARGGKVTRDLFGSDHIVSDEALLATMWQEKLIETCDRLVKDEGWAWATAEIPNDQWRYGQLQAQFKPTPAEIKRLKELRVIVEDEEIDYDQSENASEEHDALKAAILARSVTPKQKAKAGCFVRLAHDGTIFIDRGRTMPIEQGKTRQIDEDTGKIVKKKSAAAKKSGGMTLTNALRDDLRVQYHKAIKTALTTEKLSGLSSLLARIVASQIRWESKYSSAPDTIMKAYDTIANAISPKVMNAALRAVFDAKGYFTRAPKGLTLEAIAAAVNADEARKLRDKKRPEIAKFAIANVASKGWLPKELRVTAYDGPGAKGKSKSKGKSKR
jgi:ParB family chromosome partitioning protein